MSRSVGFANGIAPTAVEVLDVRLVVVKCAHCCSPEGGAAGGLQPPLAHTVGRLLREHHVRVNVRVDDVAVIVTPDCALRMCRRRAVKKSAVKRNYGVELDREKELYKRAVKQSRGTPLHCRGRPSADHCGDTYEASRPR